jgi:hypothetical protein
MNRMSLPLLGALLLALAHRGFAVGETPFASDIPPTFSYTERYEEIPNADCDVGVKNQTSLGVAPVRIDFTVSATGVNTAGFGPTTPFQFSFGNLLFNGFLGDDPTFSAGKKIAKINIETDLGQPIGETGIGGFIQIDWRGGTTFEVMIRIQNADDGYFPIAADNLDEVYADGDDPNPDAVDLEPGTAPCEFTLGDRIFSREIFYEGTADAAYSGTACEESLDRINVSGAISRPNVTIGTPAEGSESLTPFPTIGGSATNIDDAEIVDVVLKGPNGQEEFANLTGPFPIVPPPGADPMEEWLWTTNLIKLKPGKNVITAISSDDEGVESPAATRTIYYPLKSNVTVALQPAGGGTVSGGFPGTKSLSTASILTLDARPTPGWFFVGWTGSAAQTAARLQFEVVPNTNLLATFDEGPYLDKAGGYSGSGAFDDGTPGTAAAAKLTVSVTGSFTGQIFLGGERFSIRGQLDGTGSFTQIIRRAGKPDATVTLDVDLNSFMGEIGVTVTSGASTAAFAAGKVASTAAAPEAGTYTVAIRRSTTPPFDGAGFPDGHGFATMKVSAKGAATLVGKLPDGTRFSGAGQLLDDGTLFFFVQPHRRAGWFGGTLAFQNTPGTSDADGLFDWSRPAGRTFGATYPAGFTTRVAVIAARFVAPAAGVRVFPNNSPTGTVTADDDAGARLSPSPKAVAISASNIISAPADADRLRVSVNARTGLFRGSFAKPAGGSFLFEGAILQKANRGFGHFADGPATGAVDFLSVP